MTEDKNSGGNGSPITPKSAAANYPGGPKIIDQLVINLHENGRITAQLNKDPARTLNMIAQALDLYGRQLEFKERSLIQQVPPGTKIIT